jgi:hypothetical protein
MMSTNVSSIACTITLMNTSCIGSIPPQAALVAHEIARQCKAINGTCDRESIINSFTPEMLHTRQTPKRIVCYYLPLLKERGLINYTSERGSSFSIEL